jgi:hypothetical protein
MGPRYSMPRTPSQPDRRHLSRLVAKMILVTLQICSAVTLSVTPYETGMYGMNGVTALHLSFHVARWQYPGALNDCRGEAGRGPRDPPDLRPGRTCLLR